MPPAAPARAAAAPATRALAERRRAFDLAGQRAAGGHAEVLRFEVLDLVAQAGGFLEFEVGGILLHAYDRQHNLLTCGLKKPRDISNLAIQRRGNIAMKVADYTDEQLRNLIYNHERKGQFDKPAYGEALAELNQRNSNLLDFGKTFEIVVRAAAERRFVSYGEIAEANGADWNRVRYPMNHHLWLLVKKAHHNGWPMLSAIIVNKQNIETGEMEKSTLAGFIEAAKALNHEPADEQAFLKEQQQKCFEWGRNQRLN